MYKVKVTDIISYILSLRVKRYKTKAIMAVTIMLLIMTISQVYAQTCICNNSTINIASNNVKNNPVTKSCVAVAQDFLATPTFPAAVCTNIRKSTIVCQSTYDSDLDEHANQFIYEQECTSNTVCVTSYVRTDFTNLYNAQNQIISVFDGGVSVSYCANKNAVSIKKISAHSTTCFTYKNNNKICNNSPTYAINSYSVQSGTAAPVDISYCPSNEGNIPLSANRTTTMQFYGFSDTTNVFVINHNAYAINLVVAAYC